MKCPECGHNQKVKDGLRCAGCKYAFTFNPKDARSFGMTDGKFAACLRAASQNGTAWFTRNQLYAVFCSRLTRSSWIGWLIGTGLLVAGAGVALAINAVVGGVLAIVGTVVVWGMYGNFSQAKKLTRRTTFHEFMRMWKASGKEIEWLIEAPSLHEPPPEWSEPDIYDYGVERILVVERDLLVDLFVKNGAHAEQRMLVLAESGYPQYLVPVAQRLLEETPELPIFLLHDATSNGTSMKDRVLASGLLPLGGHTVTDLGMFPTDFQRLARTKRFDPENSDRTLPVDAMMLPFLVGGMSEAMTEEVTLGSILDDPQRRRSNDSSFG